MSDDEQNDGLTEATEADGSPEVGEVGDEPSQTAQEAEAETRPSTELKANYLRGIHAPVGTMLMYERREDGWYMVVADPEAPVDDREQTITVALDAIMDALTEPIAQEAALARLEKDIIVLERVLARRRAQ